MYYNNIIDVAFVCFFFASEQCSMQLRVNGDSAFPVKSLQIYFSMLFITVMHRSLYSILSKLILFLLFLNYVVRCKKIIRL